MDVQLTVPFSQWLSALREERAQDRILARLRRFQLGNLGDIKPVGQGVSEARIDYGPGYRLYFTMRAEVVIILLCGGTKRTQPSDIQMAKRMAKELNNER